MKKINPSDIILDKEEQWFEDHAEDLYKHLLPTAKLIKAAENTQNKTERMNIRMSKSDMENLKFIASKEGLPYQSLVTSILHKYTSGFLVDINEAEKILKLKERA